jgi:hypothetical protein
MIKGYEWELRGNYGSGWDLLTTENTLQGAREQLRTYIANDSAAQYKIVRVKEGK